MPRVTHTFAKSYQRQSCLCCGTLNPVARSHCQQCGSVLFLRKPNSLSRTWALLVAALICIIPANLLPIMETAYLGNSQADTILSGIIHLWDAEAYVIALIVFLASFVTPIFKITSLSYLCYTCGRGSIQQVHFRMKLYHFTELIGRWSMIDVFVVALLAALVQMGFFASVKAGEGIIAFLLVVILTMLAAATFDPRLIWDPLNETQLLADNSSITPKLQ